MTKHSLSRNNERKKEFIRTYVFRGIESMMAVGRVLQHNGNRKLAGDVFYTQEAEGENRK